MRCSPRKASLVDMSSTNKAKSTFSKSSGLPVRKFQYPKQSRFCYTRQDLHEEYGLSLDGKLYQNLGAEDVIEEDWLSMFTKNREKGSKIFLHMRRPEFMEECKLLFHKVYQGAPANKELTHKFATLFAFERCRAAKQDPAGHKVAWAIFGEQVVDHCRKLQGGIEKKMKNWVEMNEGAAGISSLLEHATTKQLVEDVLGSTYAQDPKQQSLVRAYNTAWAEMQIPHVQAMVRCKYPHIGKYPTYRQW